MSNINSVIDDIMRQVKEAVVESMELDVYYKSKEVVSKHVKSDVYNGYKSIHGYQRRMDNGGLSSEGNIQANVKATGKGAEMEIENITTGRKGFSGLSQVIEDGSGGNWNGIVPPRPFMENSAQELEKEAVKSLKKGLKSCGLKVE